jgi:hypothetical protein
MTRHARLGLVLAVVLVGSCDGSAPTLEEAAAAALSAGLAKAPDGFVACVGFDTGSDVVDFPRAVTDALVKTRPAVRPVSSCFLDRNKRQYRIAQYGDAVPLFACGAVRTLKPSRNPKAVRVECGIHHGGPAEAVGWGFEVRRTFYGALMVTDLGRVGVS